MKLTRAELTDFGAFERVRIDACPGINVFLGANGTGKSQAMKAMYALVKVGEETAPILPLDIRIREKLGRIFRTDKFSLSRLIRRSFTGHAAGREARAFLEATSGNIEVNLRLRVAFNALRPKPPVEHLGLRIAFSALRPKPPV